uniref:Uncharacterized protein n=1 Tax=Romanomermis culicivorax TaxID=13658 RepID=A0A915IDM0_ROMCU
MVMQNNKSATTKHFFRPRAYFKNMKIQMVSLLLLILAAVFHGYGGQTTFDEDDKNDHRQPNDDLQSNKKSFAPTLRFGKRSDFLDIGRARPKWQRSSPFRTSNLGNDDEDVAGESSFDAKAFKRAGNKNAHLLRFGRRAPYGADNRDNVLLRFG